MNIFWNFPLWGFHRLCVVALVSIVILTVALGKAFGISMHFGTVDLDQFLALRMTIPGISIRWSQQMIDFDLINCVNCSALGKPLNSVSFYVGHAANYHPTDSAAREKAKIL